MTLRLADRPLERGPSATRAAPRSVERERRARRGYFEGCRELADDGLRRARQLRDAALSRRQGGRSKRCGRDRRPGRAPADLGDRPWPSWPRRADVRSSREALTNGRPDVARSARTPPLSRRRDWRGDGVAEARYWTEVRQAADGRRAPASGHGRQRPLGRRALGGRRAVDVSQSPASTRCRFRPDRGNSYIRAMAHRHRVADSNVAGPNTTESLRPRDSERPGSEWPPKPKERTK